MVRFVLFTYENCDLDVNQISFALCNSKELVRTCEYNSPD